MKMTVNDNMPTNQLGLKMYIPKEIGIERTSEVKAESCRGDKFFLAID
jgi:hypothetical protein